MRPLPHRWQPQRRKQSSSSSSSSATQCSDQFAVELSSRTSTYRHWPRRLRRLTARTVRPPTAAHANAHPDISPAFPRTTTSRLVARRFPGADSVPLINRRSRTHDRGRKTAREKRRGKVSNDLCHAKTLKKAGGESWSWDCRAEEKPVDCVCRCSVAT